MLGSMADEESCVKTRDQISASFTGLRNRFCFSSAKRVVSSFRAFVRIKLTGLSGFGLNLDDGV